MKFLHQIRIAISVFALFVFFYGMFGFFYNTIKAKIGEDLNKELPINNVQGIIVTKDAIYIGLGEYSRVQKYDLKGNFITAWNTLTYSKEFTFKLNESEEPIVITKHLHRQEKKDLINSEKITDEARRNLRLTDNYDQIFNPKEFILNKNIRYYALDGFSKKLIKEDNGEKEYIINQSFITNTLSGTLNPWIVSAVGIFTFIGVNIFLVSKIMKLGNDKLELKTVFKVVFSTN